MIRVAERRDVPRMLEIYAPYVRNTTITMEYAPPTLEAFAARFDRISQRYPWIVWEENGRVLGYAYGDIALERTAYRWDADMSIYLDAEARYKGIGGQLYDCLEALLKALGYFNLYALITASNAPSCRFHEKRGYALHGLLKRSAYKFGEWHDVCWYALALRPGEAPEDAPRAFEPELLVRWLREDKT